MGKTELTGVEKTMLLPLWGRYSESIKQGGIIKDEKCIEIVEKSGIDFSGFEKEQNPASRLAWVARAWNIDRELRAVMEREKQVTVLCLGCGLDTAFYRVDDGTLRWYDMDLPNVMEIRRRLLGDNPRVTPISGSVLAPESYAAVKPEGHLVVLAVGLLYYFTEEDVKRILGRCTRLADRATVIIDYCSAKGVEVSNKTVVRNCEGARMIWSADTEEQLRSLSSGIERIEMYGVFRKIRPLLSGTDAAMADMADGMKIMSFAVMATNSAYPL